MGTSSDGGREDRPWQSYHTVYTNAKAGMDGVDKERVQRTVYEMSKGSKYFESEQRKQAFIEQKIESMRAQHAKLTASDISYFQMVADKRILELEATRDLSKFWMHVDMDAFYAAVETLENPSLKGKPLAVGGMSMICTASYEARKFGVRAAMPGFIARKLCSDLIFVPPDFKKYNHYSELTRKVFEKYDPCFIANSLDEAYLNITDVCKERGVTSGEIAEELRNAVYEATGLTCSAGVAPNRLLAKVCSDINKPNGLFVLPNERMAVMTFISSLPIRKIGGIGKVTEHVLRDVLGISTCEEMLQNSAFICALFSSCSIDFFLSVGLGLGRTDTPQAKLRKSISSERTFSASEDEALLFQRLADISETLSNDLLKEGLKGRTLTLKLKTASFEVRTRAVSLQRYFSSREDILNHASKLLKAELPLSVRLIGLRMSQFKDVDPMQKTLANFVIWGDASLNSTSGSNLSGSEANDKGMYHPIDDRVTYLPDDGCHQHFASYDFVGPSDSDHLSYLGHKCYTTDSVALSHRSFRPLKDEEHPSQLVIPNLAANATPYQEIDVLQTMESEDSSSSRHSEARDHEEMKKMNNHSAKVGCSREEQSFWIDGYICSICGIEIPPSFVEERQEHSDYHFAETLQKEESMNSNSRDLVLKQRLVQKAQHGRETRKKQKSSSEGGKYLPIDTFFVKSNNNF